MCGHLWTKRPSHTLFINHRRWPHEMDNLFSGGYIVSLRHISYPYLIYYKLFILRREAWENIPKVQSFLVNGSFHRSSRYIALKALGQTWRLISNVNKYSLKRSAYFYIIYEIIVYTNSFSFGQAMQPLFVLECFLRNIKEIKMFYWWFGMMGKYLKCQFYKNCNNNPT